MDRLKQLREQRGWTQESLADISKVNLGSIRKYEEGKMKLNKASIDTGCQLAQAFGVSVEYLVGKSDKRNDIN